MSRMMNTPTYRLALKVVNLRKSLEIANGMLAKNGSLGILCDENARPSFREASHFYYQVRKVAKAVES